MAGRGRMSRHVVHDDRRRGFRDGPPPPMPRGGGPMPPPPLPLEEQLAVGHDEIRRLVADNRMLVEENIAMKREIERAREELHALSQDIPRVRAEKEAKARELIQMGLKLEADLRALEPVKAEAMELRAEARKLNELREEMSAKITGMTQDLKRLQAENQQAPTLRREVEGLREDLVRIRTSYEHEQKARAELMDQRQVMEKNLVSMAREIEKLRAELMGREKRARGPGGGAYGGDVSYSGSFNDGYGREKGLYGTSSWGSYGPPHGFPHH